MPMPIHEMVQECAGAGFWRYFRAIYIISSAPNKRQSVCLMGFNGA